MARRARLTRHAIVTAARDLVAAEGLAALSLRPLGARLGVTAPALYAHFDSKEALIAAVAEEEFTRLIARIEAAADGVRAPIARIKAQSRAYVEYAVENPALFEILFVFRPAWSPQPDATELPIASKAFETSAVAVEDAIAAGLFRETDPLMASLTVWSAAHGVATLLAARPALGADYETALVESVIDSVVDGLAPAATASTSKQGRPLMPVPRSLLARDEPRDHDLAVRAGSWPADLSGELIISAPHPDTFDAPRAFFGDGMTYRLSLQPGTHGAAPGTFAWRQRRIDSPSARLRRKRPEVFTPTMLGVHSPFGLTNAANTAPLPWGDRLFVTWDVGRPVEIDPVTLGYLGEVGHRSEWLDLELFPQPLLPMVTSTAHPVIDPDRNVLWTVNTALGALHVVRWDGQGPLQRWPIAGAVMPQSVHTITQTQEWLIVADCAFKVEPQVFFGGERTEPANHSGPVYLIRKDALEATRPGDEVPCHAFELAPEMNHYYANYDDTDGVHVLFEHTENADIAMAQGPGDVDALGRPCDPALRGLYGFPMSPDRNTVVEFDPATGAVTQRAELREPELLWTRQLNAMDWSTEGRARPTAHHMVNQGWRPEAVTQKMLAVYKDRVDRTLWPADETAPLLMSVSMPDLQPTSHHEFALDDFPSSPIFVPRDPGADPARSRYAGSQPGGHDGYVVVPVLSDSGFRVDVFDAAAVGKGPIATLRNNTMTVPFILHSAWMPRATSAPDLERNRFSSELGRVGELPDDLAAVAHTVAHDLDEGVPLS